MRIEFQREALTPAERSVVTAGFHAHNEEHDAPEYRKDHVKWLAFDEQQEISGVLTADIQWDWIYIDELWVAPKSRSAGLGRQLMQRVEELAVAEGLEGIWLWTQSWQAEAFYEKLGYSQFTRFDNFPRGHARIGFRKTLA